MTLSSWPQRCALALSLLLWGSAAHATPTFARLFTNDAVLQRGKPVHIWGLAAVAEPITVSFNGQSVTTTADGSGKWSLYLNSMSANATGQNLAVYGAAASVTLTGVVVGDVWLASGQSNMEFSLANKGGPPYYSWPDDAQPNGLYDSTNTNLPNLRFFYVASWKGLVKNTPQDDFPASGGFLWERCVPTNGNLKYYSALAYYIARDLHLTQGVPVGVIQVAFGGTPAEAFTSLTALQSDPALAPAIPAGNPASTTDNQWPTGLFNGEINPVTPMTLKGILWNQGESNLGTSNGITTQAYEALFSGMIKDWRHRFGENLPFIFVQLPNISQLSAAGVNQTWADNCNAYYASNSGGMGDVRWAQYGALGLTNTGMSINYDLNNMAEYWSNDNTQLNATIWHPSDKEAFATRLTPWAKTLAYGASLPIVVGPLYQSFNNTGSAIQVTFDKALATTDGQPARGFALGNAAGTTWVWAESVVLAGNVATVSAPTGMPAPAQCRYGWALNPSDSVCSPTRIANLSDSTGKWLASPFKTVLEPVIKLQGASAINIIDQDMAPTPADGRDFGSVDMVTFATQTFTLQNAGNATLSLTGGASKVRVAGTNAADFTVTVQPGASVAAAGSTTFTVRFQPGGVGPRSALLLIPSNDLNHSPYYVYLKGTGTSSITPTITPTPTITQTPTITATPTQTPLTTPVPTGTYTVLPSDPNIRYTGRFDFTTPNAPRFDWPGVMIEAGFTGTSIGILLSEQWANYNWFDAYIDGSSTPTKFQTTATGVTQYNVTGLAAGAHSLRLVHRGEGFSGDAAGSPTGYAITTFHGLVLNGGESIQALSYPRPSRRIEVIGDSISVGYGDESSSTTCGAPNYERPYTNNYLAYASLAARAFCAEVHTTAISGHGMCHNYNDTVALSPYPVPALYNRTLGSSASPLYDFSSWPADAVIIYLGTNDFSNINPPSQAQYEAAYKALIADVRSKYSASTPTIFCLHATYPATYATWVSNVVNYERTTLGDLKVIDVNLGNLASANGCSSHPDLVGQQLLANTVISAMETALGWTSGVCATPTPTPTFCAGCTSTPTPTITLTPTITPTAVVPCEDWSFDTGSLQGWTVNSGPGTGLAVSSAQVHDGAGSMSVDLALTSGAPSVILSDFTGFPKDYTGKVLHAWVYVPAGMSDNFNPSAAMLVLSTSAAYHWNSSPWVNLAPGGGWSELTLDTATMSYPAEVNDVRAISVQFSLGGSSPAWSGTVYVDSVGRTTGVCAPPTATPTLTISATPSPTRTVTATSTRTQTVTPSITKTASPSPTVTTTFTDVPPGSTLTNTPLPSATATVTPSATLAVSDTSTPTPSPSATVAIGSSTNSPSRTPTPSASASPPSTASPTLTVTQVTGGGATSTPSTTPGGIGASGTPVPTPDGSLQVLGLQAVPNPDPSRVAVLLSGPADSVELRIYSVAGTCLFTAVSGPALGGWSQVPLPPIPGHGLYYARVSAKRGAQRSLPVAAVKLLVLQ